MSKDLNSCSFIGRLGKDPAVTAMPSGKSVANLSIACSDDYSDKQSGQKVEQTNWINIVAFDRLAEIIGQYLKKGSRIYISGKQVTRKWQDKTTGADRYSTEIVANNLQMLDSKPDEGGQGYAPQSQGQPVQQQAPAQQQAAPQGQPQAQGFDDFSDDIGF